MSLTHGLRRGLHSSAASPLGRFLSLPDWSSRLERFFALLLGGFDP
jgi:hypothetical protein